MPSSPAPAAAPTEAFVWTWLPGQTTPVVAGRLAKATGGTYAFNYGQSYLARPDAISLNERELPLQTGALPLLPGLSMPGCIRDASPDAWGRRVIINRTMGLTGAAAAAVDLDELTYLLESGSDRIGALDFQTSASVHTPRAARAAPLAMLLQAAENVEQGVPLTPELDAALRHGSSIGGARPKAMIEDGDKKFIAKFSASNDLYSVVKAEFIAMRLATECALTVAPVRLERALNKDVLLIERFDRDRTADVVAEAIRIGYRHLDSACDYGNEREAGEGIRRAVAAGHCRRDDLWITSKLWNTYHEPSRVRAACERTLADLGVEQLDLYLVHFPIALEFVPFEERYPPGWVRDPAVPAPRMHPIDVPLADTWGAMERLVEAGLVKQIGLCNCPVGVIRELASRARIAPAVLQVEMHPFLVQEKLLRFCRESGMAVTAFSPLGAGSYVPLGMATPEDSVLSHPAVLEIATATGRTPAQVILRWGIQRGTSVIPKTSRLERLAENLDVESFTLDDGQMRAIAGLDRHRRYNDPGVFCELAFGTYFPIYD